MGDMGDDILKTILKYTAVIFLAAVALVTLIIIFFA
jgi:hypothetical protein